jgi:hypothetical protein
LKGIVGRDMWLLTDTLSSWGAGNQVGKWRKMECYLKKLAREAGSD